MCVLIHFSHAGLLTILQTVARQASLPMGFSRQEHWSALPCPSPGDLHDPGIQPASLGLLHWQADSLPLTPPGKPQVSSICFPASGILLLLSPFLLSLASFMYAYKKESVKKNHLYCFAGVSRVNKGLSAFIEFNYFYLGMPWTLFFILFMMTFMK